MRSFHPLVVRWFLEQYGRPTDLQEQAWPLIAGGENVLITAPTGSGKTLAAFLFAIDRLITGKWPLEKTSVLYVSPLKALNNDIQRNLLVPLSQLKKIFENAGKPFPPIRVLTRSGDTPPSERRRMLRHPPEILITTPESLNLLLSSPASRTVLTGILAVIMDEIHAVVATKRGTHLITAVDRLVPLSGEFQRIALSATIEPLDTVAAFAGGFRAEGNLRYTPRPVRILKSSIRKQYDIHVDFPDALPEGGDSFWQPYVEKVKSIIYRNRSTLVFVNSRRFSERLTHLVNLGEERPVAYAHHGSLSREIRLEVERKLKAGELRAIVATNSLELGIDIGTLDEVVLVQSPPSLSSAVQRIGRAGHRVGEISTATMFPANAQEAVKAAVLASGVMNHDIERTRIVDGPLDVLAQILVSMTGPEPWDIDRLFGQIKASYPYRNLPRAHFDLVLDMLAGRFKTTRIRELEPRISIDRLDNTVRARRGALYALYSSGGTIPDRGYFHLRHMETNARIGELDEEFVWEARIGQVFTLGTQNWRIERITHNDVFVLPSDPQKSVPPFWKAEESLRDFHFSERVSEFLETADEHLEDPEFQYSLARDYRLKKTASESLIRFLRRQKEITGRPLPHRHHLLVEYVSSGPAGYPGTQVVLHTFWGGRVNRPYAMAIEAGWESRFGHRVEIYPGDDCILIQLPQEAASQDILSLVTSGNVMRLLRRSLEGSGFFGARFRECAGRALLLTRHKFHERMPLWMNRLRSQKLLDAVLPHEDFPILLEAWRTCLKDEFDMESLSQVLSELESGALTWSEARTSQPSPMAQTITWPQINQYMYEDDRTKSGKTSRLRRDLIQQVVFTPELRPSVPLEIVGSFEKKRKRLAEGYTPDRSEEMLDWVKERVLIPLSEWEELLAGVGRDHRLDPESLLSPIGHKLVRIHPHAAREPLIVAVEVLPLLRRAFYQGEEVGDFHPEPNEESGDEQLLISLLSNWLGFYGPATLSSIQSILGIDLVRLEGAIADLTDAERLINGRLIEDSAEEYLCDAENFETLLRLARADRRPVFEPMELPCLQTFLSLWQGCGRKKGGPEPLEQSLEQLTCYAAPAGAWETEILPARLRPYNPSWLDAAIQASGLIWLGMKSRRICFCFRNDLDLLGEEWNRSDAASEGEELFPDPRAKYDFSTLRQISEANPTDLAESLWKGVWKGRITNDTFMALRRGIETGFRMPTQSLDGTGTRHHGRSGFNRWKSTVPFAGNWQRVMMPSLPDDLIEKEERNKDRARLLLDRYGILFRELLLNELPPFRWPSIFRALRLMELSGEVLTGYFFHGIPGPQFISHKAFHSIRRVLSEDIVYWISATDPSSLCGIPLKGLKGRLPRRVAGTHLVYRGSSLVLVSQQSGKRLTFHVLPDDPMMQDYLEFLRVIMARGFQPFRRIVIESINGKPAHTSPYADVFRASFDVSAGYKDITLYSRIAPLPPPSTLP